jgi:hypothetical protein
MTTTPFISILDTIALTFDMIIHVECCNVLFEQLVIVQMHTSK